MRSVAVISAAMLVLVLIESPARIAQDKPAEPFHLLQLSESEEPRTLDPHKAGDVVASRHCALVYESLLEYDPFEPTRLRPCLAESMPTVDEAGKTYTFRLRDDIFFQDDLCFEGGKGRKLVAADLVYSFKRLAALRDTEGFWTIEGRVVGLDEFRVKANELEGDAWSKHLDSPVEGLKATDDRTFVISLAERYPQLQYVLALGYGAVIAREACEKYGDDMAKHPVGTGPFVLKEWEPNGWLQYDRNKAYREVKLAGVPQDSPLKPYEGKRLPLSDIIHYEIIPESAAEFGAFSAGQLVQAGIDKDQWSVVFDPDAMKAGKQGDDLLRKELRENGVHLRTTEEPVLSYIAFNMNDSVVGTSAGEKGRAIRQALSLSFDRDRLIREQRHFRGTSANQLVPPDVSGHLPENALKHQCLDAKLGRELLKKAGFDVQERDGKYRTLDTATGKQVRVTVCLRRQDTTEYAAFLKECGAAVGIEFSAEAMTFSDFLKRQEEGKGQAYDSGWVMDYPDAQNLLQLLYGPNKPPGLNGGSFDHQGFNMLYEEMSRLDDQVAQQRKHKLALIKRMHDIIDQQTPWIVINYNRAYSLYREGLRQPPPSPFSYNLSKYKVFEAGK